MHRRLVGVQRGVSAGIAEALNCFAMFLIVTLWPIAAYLYLRVSAERLPRGRRRGWAR
jgi:hypothetical protein